MDQVKSYFENKYNISILEINNSDNVENHYTIVFNTNESKFVFPSTMKFISADMEKKILTVDALYDNI